MPRNSSGAYSLVAGNPVITGTVIQSDWANTTMPDIGNELSDSLSRSGKGGMNAQMKFIQGSAPTPAMSFGAFPQSGMYAADGNDIRMSVAGVDRFRWLAANALPQTWDSVGGVWLDVGGGGVIWSEVDVLPNPVMISNGYSTLGGQTAVLPDNPPTGFSVAFADKADSWSSTNFLTVDGNGNTFTQDGSATYELDLKGAFAQFSFIDGQWQIVNFGRLSDYYGVDTDNFATKVELNNPNLLINGLSRIGQYGNAFSKVGDAGPYYLYDCWFGSQTGGGVGSENWNRFPDTLTTGQEVPFVSVVQAGTQGITRYCQILTAADAEGLGGQAATFSLDIKANQATTSTFDLYVTYDTDDATLNSAAATGTPFETVGSLAGSSIGNSFNTTVTKASLTVDIPVNAHRVAVILLIDGATAGHGYTFSGLQLEKSSVATDFDFVRLPELEASCFSRYWDSGATTLYGTQGNINDTFRNFVFHYPQAMIDVPAITLDSPLAWGFPKIDTSYASMNTNLGNTTANAFINGIKLNANL